MKVPGVFGVTGRDVDVVIMFALNLRKSAVFPSGVPAGVNARAWTPITFQDLVVMGVGVITGQPSQRAQRRHHPNHFSFNTC